MGVGVCVCGGGGLRALEDLVESGPGKESVYMAAHSNLSRPKSWGFIQDWSR